MRSQTLPAPVESIVTAIRDDTIGGAADMARLTAQALDALAQEAAPETFRQQLDASVQALVEVTPSIMPVVRVLHLTVAAAEANPDDARRHVSAAAKGFVTWLETALTDISRIGADMIRDGERIFLYSMSSTVYRMIEAAVGQGKRVSLVTTESRPANEGLTSLQRLCPQGVEVTIGIDAGLVQLMRGCTSVYIGSDTVTSAGECLAKVGCYSTALAAKHFGLPFYVAGDTSKLDPATIRGVPIKIREMPATDVVPDGVPAGGFVRNPIFEVIPSDLVTAYVTEIGILHPGAIHGLMASIPWSDRVGDIVAANNRT